MYTSVENTSLALIDFPPDPKNNLKRFRRGPGNNPKVLAKAVKHLEEGTSGTKGASKEWKRLKELGVIKVASAAESVVLAAKPEGPAVPHNLVDRSAPAALAIIKVTSDAEVLQMWAKAERRPQIAKAIEERLVELSGTSPAG